MWSSNEWKVFWSCFFNYHFNYEERLLGLVEKFKIHLSLFSVFMHFVRCIRSCEKVSTARTYCKVCSRVADFHLNSKTLFSKYSSDIIWFFIVRFKFWYSLWPWCVRLFQILSSKRWFLLLLCALFLFWRHFCSFLIYFD